MNIHDLLGSHQSSAMTWINAVLKPRKPALGSRLGFSVIAVFALSASECSVNPNDLVGGTDGAQDGVVQSPKVAMDGAGNGMIVYEEADRRGDAGSQIVAERYDAADGLVEGYQLAGGGSTSFSNRGPDIGIDATGIATAVWIREDFGNTQWRDQMRLRQYRNQTWEPAITLSAGSGAGFDHHHTLFSAQVAVAADGDGFATWIEHITELGADAGNERNSVALMASPIVSGGANAIIDSVETNTNDPRQRAGITNPRIAISESGRRMIIYERDASLEDGIFASVDDGAGFFDLPTRIDLPLPMGGDFGAGPDLALDPNGNATVVWRGVDNLYWTRYTGTWSPAGSLPVTNATSGNSPKAVSDADGNVTVVWSTPDGVFASRALNQAGALSWQVTEQLNSASAANTLQALAVSPDGVARAVWTELNNQALFTNEFRDGAWQGAESIPQSGVFFQPDIAMDASGDGIAVWSDDDFQHFVWRAPSPPGTDNPPTALFTYSPATPIVNEVVSFNASTSSDDFGVDMYEWDFENDGLIDSAGDDALVEFSFADAGATTVRLRVTDSVGQTDEITQTLTIVEAGGSDGFGIAVTISNQGGSPDDRVISDPPAIDCRAGPDPLTNAGTCEAMFSVASVRLIAIRASGDLFDQWSSNCDAQEPGDGAPVCIVNNPGDGGTVAIGAAFEPPL